MNTLEDRLRAAAQVITEVIPEGSAPPPRLAEPRSRHSGAGQRGRRGWTERLAPLAAAAGTHGTTVVGVLANGKFTQLPGLTAPITSVDADPAGIAW